MLTGHQCQVTAYTDNGALICRPCAVQRHGTLHIERVEAGLTSGSDLSPLIRYTVDSECFTECAECDGWGELQDDLEGIICPQCEGDGRFEDRCEDCGGELA
jgi:hypothetical protein